MKGKYIYVDDGWGIIGNGYVCPECEHITLFVDCEEGCEECDFSEEYVDPDEWLDEKYGR